MFRIPVRIDIDDRSLEVLRLAGRTNDRRLAYVALVGTWVAAVVVAALLAGCLRPAVQTPAQPYTLDEQARAAVTIESLCIGDAFRAKTTKSAVLGGGAGSGAIIGTYGVVTAAHVINCPTGSPVVGVIDHTGRRRVADIAAIDYVHDVARLVVREPFVDTHAPCFAAPRVSQLVSAYTGYPERASLHGRVTDVRMRDASWRRVDLGLDMHVVAGNSGSGIYDDRGCLVGVVTHSVDTLGLCALTGSFCEGYGATVVGKGVLP